MKPKQIRRRVLCIKDCEMASDGQTFSWRAGRRYHAVKHRDETWSVEDDNKKLYRVDENANIKFDKFFSDKTL